MHVFALLPLLLVQSRGLEPAAAISGVSPVAPQAPPAVAPVAPQSPPAFAPVASQSPPALTPEITATAAVPVVVRLPVGERVAVLGQPAPAAVAQPAPVQLAAQPAAQPPVQPASDADAAATRQKSQPAASEMAATAAANAANAAANAAEAAAVAASTAANAAASATTAANAAATANTVADAAASANTAANAAASANAAADVANFVASKAEVAANEAAHDNAVASAAAVATVVAATAKQATMAAAAQQAAATAVAAAIVRPAVGTASSSAPVVATMATAAQQAAAVAPAAVPVAPAAPTVVMAPHIETSWSSSQWYFVQFSQLLYGLSFAMVIKALCVAGNVLVQVSPFPQVRRWEQRGCTGEADAAPYVSIAFGGCQWCFYGTFAWLVTTRSGFLILVHSNLLGAVLGTYYVRTFYMNCRSELALATLQKYLSAVTALALLQVCAMSVLPAERALFLTGLISSFCSFIGATSVLVTVPAVVRTKDSRSIPGPYAIANLASSLVWSLCGYILDDPLVMVPNMFSTVCSGTSLGLKLLYPSDLFSSGVDTKHSSVEEGMDLSLTKAPAFAKRAFNAPSAPSEFTPMKPRTLKDTSADTFPENFDWVSMPAVASAGDGCADGGDGTGGTGGDGTGGTW